MLLHRVFAYSFRTRAVLDVVLLVYLLRLWLVGVPMNMWPWPVVSGFMVVLLFCVQLVSVDLSAAVLYCLLLFCVWWLLSILCGVLENRLVLSADVGTECFWGVLRSVICSVGSIAES